MAKPTTDTSTTSTRRDIRNVAIIAHVDHGKTTLVDALLSVAGAFQRGESHSDRAMDSGDLERERGITITSKPTALRHRDVQINLVDTPGHADFGGEVERVLNMVDAVLLLVDAFEGPMPQTRFVTEKAVARGLKVLLAVNKIDRDGSTPHKAVDMTFDLLASVGASEEQLDFPVCFCSARERYAMADPDDDPQSMEFILDFLLEHAPPPEITNDGELAMWVSTLDHDPYLGYLAIGRLRGGVLRPGDRVALVRPSETPRDPAANDAPEPTCVEQFRVRKLLGFQGTHRFERDEVHAGDIVAVAGMATLQVGDTLTTDAIETRVVFPRLEVDPPTMTMRFRINDGPFAGLEGRWVTSRKIEERLKREIKSNVALQVSDTESRDEFEVAGRGELHLSVLIETMRREGYELCVSRPRVILRETPEGETLEPYEHVVLRCGGEYSGVVIEALSQRQGELIHMEAEGDTRTRLEFKIPARGLIGYRGSMLTETRGTGVMSSVFAGYGPYLGPRRTRHRGVLVALESGVTMTYSLHRLQERGVLFVGPQVKVYAGMIVGESSREGDLIVNPCTAKKFTNVRAAGADEKLLLTPPRVLSLEEALAFIEADELLEVTPQSLRLRKRQLDHSARKRDEKALKASAG
ncbi:MAG: translational GTPase TypA [Myxococcales bacterium]|nr:translational GTPase TypA [Myxococcales bacterium]MCB9752286.1 translational GTPase TypA [Myxococcales bacterium]